MNDFVGKQIDRYRITQRLGVGGMAVVYKAYDTRLERDVALKLIRSGSIPPDEYDRLMKRFEREAKAQAVFNHRHIIPIYDYGEVQGSPYLVMAYIPGGTLKTRIGQPIPFQQAIHWVVPIADALNYAHKRGVIHRDVKPSNILFNEEEQPLLSDFGIAKIIKSADGSLTGTGLGVGTPEYMAPEQWHGQVSEASDQYALGVVLYEMLTGLKPYTADTPVAVALLQMSEPLRSPRSLVPNIPEPVEKLLYKALDREPQNRFSDVASFQKALEYQFLLDPADEIDQVESININKESTPVLPTPEPVSDTETINVMEPTLSDSLHPSDPSQSSTSSNKPKPKGTRFVSWVLWVVGLLLLVIILVAGIIIVRRLTSTPVVPTEAISSLNNPQITQMLTRQEDSNNSATLTMVKAAVTISPTVTLTITPTITNTEIVLRAHVIVDHALLRTGPDFSHPIISERLQRDIDLIIRSKNPSETWFLVKIDDGLDGWLYKDWIELDVQSVLIPIESIIPTSPPADSSVPLATATPVAPATSTPKPTELPPQYP
ncbi:MAG: protein kinase [Anaerolineaceae bacterium]|nr:protein kinase [Anaerolineaceae bacterium]